MRFEGRVTIVTGASSGIGAGRQIVMQRGHRIPYDNVPILADAEIIEAWLAAFSTIDGVTVERERLGEVGRPIVVERAAAALQRTGASHR